MCMVSVINIYGFDLFVFEMWNWIVWLMSEHYDHGIDENCVCFRSYNMKLIKIQTLWCSEI